MIPWAKMASDLDLDPAIIRAGRNGREVYLLLLRRCALGDSRGFVSARHLDPEVIARILMCSVADAQDGIDACLRESLVVTDVRDQRDGVTIVAWEKWNGSRKEPLSVTERKAKSRKLKREREQVTKVTEVTTEKIREEESREEDQREREPSPPAQGAPVAPPALALVAQNPPAKAARKAPPRPLPADWKPSADHERLASQLGVSAAAEADKMRDWALAKSERGADWEARFRNWLRDSASRSRAGPSRGGGRHPWEPTTAGSDLPRLLDDIERMEREQ